MDNTKLCVTFYMPNVMLYSSSNMLEQVIHAGLQGHLNKYVEEKLLKCTFHFMLHVAC